MLTLHKTGNILRAGSARLVFRATKGSSRMKTLRIAMACALVASFGAATASQARPHHRVCKTTFVHHHKVTRCR